MSAAKLHVSRTFQKEIG